jgi:hypothetical protein
MRLISAGSLVRAQSGPLSAQAELRKIPAKLTILTFSLSVKTRTERTISVITEMCVL